MKETIKKLYSLLDKLELLAIVGFFDEVAKKNELDRVVRELKQLIRSLENS